MSTEAVDTIVKHHTEVIPNDRGISQDEPDNGSMSCSVWTLGPRPADVSGSGKDERGDALEVNCALSPYGQPARPMADARFGATGQRKSAGQQSPWALRFWA